MAYRTYISDISKEEEDYFIFVDAVFQMMRESLIGQEDSRDVIIDSLREIAYDYEEFLYKKRRDPILYQKAKEKMLDNLHGLLLITSDLRVRIRSPFYYRLVIHELTSLISQFEKC